MRGGVGRSVRPTDCSTGGPLIFEVAFESLLEMSKIGFLKIFWSRDFLKALKKCVKIIQRFKIFISFLLVKIIILINFSHIERMRKSDFYTAKRH